MANAKTTVRPSTEMTVTISTYQNGGGLLPRLIGHLQQLMDRDETISIAISSYGDDTMWLTFKPNVPQGVVCMVVDHYIISSEDGNELRKELGWAGLAAIHSILETADLMK